MNIKQRTKRIISELPAIFIAIKKRKTPILAKVFGTLTIVYALSPIDLIPDFIPILGYLDDIIILPILIMLTRFFIPDYIMEECRKESKDIWKNGKPKKWYYAVPIILIWLVTVLLIYFNFIK